MKNHKVFGETYVSLGCVDFSQVLFGIFDEDLKQDIHFYGLDCSLVSIVRCKLLYKMILNKAPSRLIQVSEMKIITVTDVGKLCMTRIFL